MAAVWAVPTRPNDRRLNGGCQRRREVVVDYVVSCPADLDLDGDVGIVDFLALLGAWSTDPRIQGGLLPVAASPGLLDQELDPIRRHIQPLSQSDRVVDQLPRDGRSTLYDRPHHRPLLGRDGRGMGGSVA